MYSKHLPLAGAYQNVVVLPCGILLTRFLLCSTLLKQLYSIFWNECRRSVGSVLSTNEQAAKHLLAGLIHIEADESERDVHFMPETETSTHGHVMLHKP